MRQKKIICLKLIAKTLKEGQMSITLLSEIFSLGLFMGVAKT